MLTPFPEQLSVLPVSLEAVNDALSKAENRMKKKQRKVRLIRAAIQLIFFIAAPSLFSTAFAGIKSIFLAIGGQQSVTWNSFLDITALLLIITILFGRHFCGYACAFGTRWEMLCMSLPHLSVRNAFRKKEKTWISGRMGTQTYRK